MTTGINDVIQTDKLKLVRYILYMKLFEKGIILSDNELSLFALFSETEDTAEVITKAISTGYVKSWQTGENVISKLVNMELLIKKDTKSRTFPEWVFPNESLPSIAAKIILIGYAGDQVQGNSESGS